jgi:hypothetical protein
MPPGSSSRGHKKRSGGVRLVLWAQISSVNYFFFTFAFFKVAQSILNNLRIIWETFFNLNFVVSAVT